MHIIYAPIVNVIAILSVVSDSSSDFLNNILMSGPNVAIINVTISF